MALASSSHVKSFRSGALGSAAMRAPMARVRVQLQVVAFKENQSVQDWRTQKMRETAHTYYHDCWNKGTAVESVIDNNIIFRDNVWGTPASGSAPLVGLRAFKQHLSELRQQYPDMWFEVEQYGLQDPLHLFVQWNCHETQLNSKSGPASLHSSVFSGVDILTFNAERDKVVEVSQFRQPTYEERKEHEPKHDASPYEIKLARLHWDHHEPEGQASHAPQHPPQGAGKPSRGGFKRL